MKTKNKKIDVSPATRDHMKELLWKTDAADESEVIRRSLALHVKLLNLNGKLFIKRKGKLQEVILVS